MAILKPKKQGYGLKTKTIRGKSGQSYVVHRTQEGSFHVFVEVEAKAAAVDCGAPKTGNTRSQWEAVWKKH